MDTTLKQTHPTAMPAMTSVNQRTASRTRVPAMAAVTAAVAAASSDLMRGECPRLQDEERDDRRTTAWAALQQGDNDAERHQDPTAAQVGDDLETGG